MSRKITIIMIIIISIVSVAIVTFFGISPNNHPQTIAVEEVMFVKYRGSGEEEKITRRATYLTEQEETLEIYYFVKPMNATNKNINVVLDGNEKCDNITYALEDGVIIIDFLGVDFTNSGFRVSIFSEDGNKTANHQYVFEQEENF